MNKRLSWRVENAIGIFIKHEEKNEKWMDSEERKFDEVGYRS
jgi:hypothetical protein